MPTQWKWNGWLHAAHWASLDTASPLAPFLLELIFMRCITTIKVEKQCFKKKRTVVYKQTIVGGNVNDLNKVLLKLKSYHSINVWRGIVFILIHLQIHLQRNIFLYKKFNHLVLQYSDSFPKRYYIILNFLYKFMYYIVS